MNDLRAAVVDAVERVRSLPYAWPVPPDADAARRLQAGSCASKHALLAEELDALGIVSCPLLMIGPLVPRALCDVDELAEGARLLEVHECLTVLTPWTGPLRVDVTWDPPLVRHGLKATLPWDGRSDMETAVAASDPGWSVPRERLREAKEALRARLYGPGERGTRDRVLAALAAHFARWRDGTRAGQP